MTTLTFDTHAFVKRLIDVGILEPQAEAMSDAFKEAQNASTSELATKADLLLVETRLEGKIDKVKTELLSEIKASKAESKLFFIVLICVFIITNPTALELLSKVLGIAK